MIKLLLFLFFLNPRQVFSEEKMASRVVTLNEAIVLASQNNLELKAGSEVLGQAFARKTQADATAFPKLSATSIVSPIYKETGNPISSERDLSKWGVWAQNIVTVAEPIYTWGRISNLKKAAENGIAVAEAQVVKNTLDLHYEVRELYYSCILAEQLYRFLEEAQKTINEVQEKSQNSNQNSGKKINKRDSFKIALFQSEIQIKFQETEQLRTLARHALSLKLGFDPQTETIPYETMLEPIEKQVPSYDEMEKVLVSNRPELKQLDSGILAKQSLLKVEKAAFLPQFFVGGMLSFAYSNMRNAQSSAYANDPYNRNTGGFGLGIQWNWDLATSFANQGLISSEIAELEKKRDYAQLGVRLELRKALLDLELAYKNKGSFKTAFETGKKWLIHESVGYSLDPSDLKNLGDAFNARAQTTKAYWESIYKLNLAWAQLSKTVGKEL